MITATARDAEVGLFNRFIVMRNSVEGEKMSFEQFLSPDGLHLNDWSYACVAKLLATAILEGTKLPPAVAAPATSSGNHPTPCQVRRADPRGRRRDLEPARQAHHAVGVAASSRNARRATTKLMRRSKCTTKRGRSCKVRPLSPNLRIPPY